MTTTAATIDTAAPAAKRRFDRRHLPAKGLALLIEHLPCCILSMVAASIGLPFMRHNPVIELGFAVFGAIFGEWIGHKYFLKNHTHDHGLRATFMRYGFALSLGLTTWWLHQIFFHHHDHGHIFGSTLNLLPA